MRQVPRPEPVQVPRHTSRLLGSFGSSSKHTPEGPHSPMTVPVQAYEQ